MDLRKQDLSSISTQCCEIEFDPNGHLEEEHKSRIHLEEATFCNLSKLRAGSGLDDSVAQFGARRARSDSESSKGEQHSIYPFTPMLSHSNNKKEKKVELEKRPEELEEEQQELSNQVEMIAEDLKLSLPNTNVRETTTTQTQNYDNDNSFGGQSWSESAAGITSEPRGGHQEQQHRQAAAEWNLMQIVESAESKLMRQKQVREREEELRKLWLQQQQQESQAEASSRSKTNSGTNNSSLEPQLSTRSALATQKAPRLMLKSPAFATITLDQQNGLEEQQQPLVSDCGRKQTSSAKSESERSSGQACPLSAPNMTNRLEPSCNFGALSTVGGCGQQRRGEKKEQDEDEAKCDQEGNRNRNSDLSRERDRVRVRKLHRPTTRAAEESDTGTPLSSSGLSRLNRSERSKQGADKTLSGQQILFSNSNSNSNSSSRSQDELEGDREGPTPTNDLIRALIQRDKAALSRKWRQNEAESGSSSRKPIESLGQRASFVSSSTLPSSSSSSLNEPASSPSSSSSSSLSEPKQVFPVPTPTTELASNGQPNRPRRKRARQAGNENSNFIRNQLEPTGNERKGSSQEESEGSTRSRAVIRTEAGELNLTSGGGDYDNNKRIKHQQRALKQKQEVSDNDSEDTTTTTTRRLANRMSETHRDKRQNWTDSFAAGARELSAQLISKCHLGASLSGNQSELGVVGRATDAGSDPSEQPRRHSTYMLPVLLNRDNPNSSAHLWSSSSSDTEPEPEPEPEPELEHEHGHELESGAELNQMERRDEESDVEAAFASDLDEELAGLASLPEPATPVDNRNLSDLALNPGPNSVTRKSALKAAKLPTSASSPSALSTPTNDNAGCGGPCCSQHAQVAPGQSHLIGVAGSARSGTSNAYEAKVIKRIRKLSLFMSSNGSAASRQQSATTGTCESEPISTTATTRPRVGSNPNERLKLTGGNKPDSGELGEFHSAAARLLMPTRTRARIQSVGAASELATCSGGPGKRHSIINILSGQAGSGNSNPIGLSSQHLSKLNPRSLFSSSSSANHGSKSAKAKGSLESDINKLSGGTNWPLSPSNNLLPLTGRRDHHQQQFQQNNKLCSSEHQQRQQEQCEPLIPESGFKIVVMGTSGSGKTSIIQRFMYNSFNWRHLPTVEDTYFIEFPYKKNLINISISDTSGTYQFPAMKRLAINSGDAFILVYSVDNPDSFEELKQLRQTILDEREQAYLEASASLVSCESNAVSSSQSSGLASTSSGCSSQSQSSALSKQLRDGKEDVKSTSNLPQMTPSPSRHWSLGSLFHHQHNNNTANNINAGNNNNNSNNTSLSSSICSSTCSSNDTSRRSSVSAAEAALRTRRTRRPPMVIVANKLDLPQDRHLVNSDEIEALAVIDWNNGFIRASAALNTNIDEIFQQVLKQARQPLTMAEAILSKRRKSLPPKLPH